MAFNFFGFKKKPDIQDVEIKAPLEEEKPQPLSETESQPQTVLNPEAEVSNPSEVASAQKLTATREDVLAAYKIFFGRLPESEEVIKLWVGTNPEAVLAGFLKSAEFLDHPQKSQFILALAKKVLDDRRKAEAPAEDENSMAKNPEASNNSNA